MGYKRKTLHLTFDDKPGLEFYIRSVSVRRALRLMRLAGEMGDDKSEEQSQADIEELFGAFADRVVSWSLEEDDDDEDGKPVPVPVTLARCRESGKDFRGTGRCAEHAENEAECSITGLLDWDFDDAMGWVLTWIQQATSVVVPTGAPAQETTAGAMEMSIPMASPSGM